MFYVSLSNQNHSDSLLNTFCYFLSFYFIYLFLRETRQYVVRHDVRPFLSGLQEHTLGDSSGPETPEDPSHPSLQRKEHSDRRGERLTERSASLNK